MNIAIKKIRSLFKFRPKKIHPGIKLFIHTLGALESLLFNWVTSSWVAIFGFWLKFTHQVIQVSLRQGYRAVLFGLFLIILLLLPGLNAYETIQLNPETAAVNTLPISLPTPALYPVNLKKSSPPPFSANAIFVSDVASAVVIYEKNADVPLSPASTTKIMTALVALEHFPLDEIIKVREITNQGRVMHLVPGEKISVEALLYGILVHSANDAAVALAAAFPGGSETFINEMNSKARQLHLVATHFVNPNGFYDKDQQVSARDLARLSMVALNNPTFAKIVSTRSITVSNIDFTRFHQLVNVNELLGQIPGVGGLKTGYTQESGENLVAFIVTADAKFLTIVLGSNDRFSETEKLISWVRENFTWDDKFMGILSVGHLQQKQIEAD